ncbi:MAG: aldo/keto reductase [Spirochaetales bacterium]|nr:aldo/keto reductase [Spirochaetales bacterium]
MQYRSLGNTGVEISAIGFGAMRLPTVKVGDKERFDHDKGVELIRRYIELGGNYVDTAPYYCEKESEIIVGKALKGRRDQVYLSTKNPIENASGDDYRRRLETSLEKLDTDYIDFYHMWGISWKTYRESIDVPGGPLDAALKAKEEGLIRHLSFSFHDDAANMLKIIDTGNFETLLCQYNLLDRSNEEGIAHARSKGLGVIVMGPVGGGRLGFPSEVIQGLLPDKKVSNPELAMRFVLANPGVNCALSGMGSMQMVEENCATGSRTDELSPAELEAISVSMEENKRLADLYCTGCNYCMPCPTGVNIPLNFSLMNHHRIYDLTEHAKDQYSQIGKVEWLKGKPASECIECGECESKCPQKIPIISQLKETAETLGA